MFLGSFTLFKKGIYKYLSPNNVVLCSLHFFVKNIFPNPILYSNTVGMILLVFFVFLFSYAQAWCPKKNNS